MLLKTALAVIALALAAFAGASAKPTIYKRNGQDKLMPVLVPISSTVVPLPIYKVSYSLGAKGEKGKHDYEDAKLITLKKLKKNKEKASVKAMSREDFEDVFKM